MSSTLFKVRGYKLSPKEAITREDLRTFHADLSKYLERVFGRDIGVLNEVTKESETLHSFSYGEFQMSQGFTNFSRAYYSIIHHQSLC